MQELPSYSLISLNQQQNISDYYGKIQSFLNTSNLYQACKESVEYQKFKDTFASAVITMIDKSSTANFEKGMNIFEKMGFLSNDKYNSHMQKLGFKKGLADFTIRTAFDLGPMVLDHYRNQKKMANIEEYYIGWIAYINKHNSIKLQESARKFSGNLGKELDLNYYFRTFDKYANSGINLFPILSKENNSQARQLCLLIMQTCDINETIIAERCVEFACDGVGIPHQDALTYIEQIKQNQLLVSDISQVSSISICTVLQDLANSWNHAQQYSRYQAENNPYGQNREKALKIINSIKEKSKELGELGIPFVTSDKVTAVQMAKPAITYTLNEDLQPTKALEIVKRMKRLQQEVDNG